MSKDLIILTIATEYNKYVVDWENSVKKLGYNYKILGIGVSWKGFNTKMKLILDEISEYSGDQIFAVVDCYDLLFCKDQKNL